jgi:hypothetical protein
MPACSCSLYASAVVLSEPIVPMGMKIDLEIKEGKYPRPLLHTTGSHVTVHHPDPSQESHFFTLVVSRSPTNWPEEQQKGLKITEWPGFTLFGVIGGHRTAPH